MQDLFWRASGPVLRDKLTSTWFIIFFQELIFSVAYHFLCSIKNYFSTDFRVSFLTLRVAYSPICSNMYNILISLYNLYKYYQLEKYMLRYII